MSKTWEEEFDEKFGTNDDVIFGGKKDGMDMHELYIKLKNFIASQIEKARREAIEDLVEVSGVTDNVPESYIDEINKGGPFNK